MWHVILLILKIIGLILLSVLGLLVLAVLMMLFIPVRYRASFRKEEDIQGRAQVTYLGFVVRLLCTYEKEQFHYSVKLFGKTLFSDEKKNAPQHTKEKQKDKKQKKGTKQKQGKKQKQAKNKLIKAEKADTLLTLAEDITAKEQETPAEDTAGQLLKMRSEDAPAKEQEISAEDVTFDSEDTFYDTDFSEEYQSTGSSFWKRSKLYKGWQKVKAFFSKLLQIFRYLDEEDSRNVLSMLLSEGQRLLLRLAPTKTVGTIIFGTGDPYSTGRLLAVFGVFYGLYANFLTVTPDFENRIFLANIKTRGRMRMITFLHLLIKLYRNKQLKVFMEGFPSR